MTFCADLSRLVTTQNPLTNFKRKTFISQDYQETIVVVFWRQTSGWALESFHFTALEDSNEIQKTAGHLY